MSRISLFVVLFTIIPFLSRGQFAPPVGNEGTTAIHKDSSIFVNWAASVEVVRGEQNIADDSLNYAEAGEPNFALGAPDNQTVSLGDKGYAILTFDPPISNGDGFDFAVFENGFTTQGGYFLELAFVEVSSDGQFFVRFPATSLTDTSTQLNTFDLVNPTQINNLAGKYEINYGTPFDLAALDKIPELDLNKITHVKVIDVIGSLADSLATRDTKGNKINDPFPTPFPSGGFDLDAVGVIHQNTSTSSIDIGLEKVITIFPNPLPLNEVLMVKLNVGIKPKLSYQLLDNLGRTIKQNSIKSQNFQVSFKGLSKGNYWLNINYDSATIIKKVLVLD